MESKQCFICKSWMDGNQLVKGDDGFLRCYEHAYLNQETLIAALREAGEKMELALGKVLYKIAYSSAGHPFKISEIESFRDAFKAWEAANK
jgi:hypothetical protein